MQKFLALAALLVLPACDQLTKPATPIKAPAEVGRYQLRIAYEKTLLLDTATGCVEEVFISEEDIVSLAGSVGFNCEAEPEEATE